MSRRGEVVSLVVIRGGLSDPVTASRLERTKTLLTNRDIVVIRDDEELLERAGDVEVCFGRVSRAFVNAARSLTWLQWDAAGVDSISGAFRGRKTVLTTASGVHRVPIAEHLLALIFALARRLDYAFSLQWEHAWKEGRGPEVMEVQDSTVLLLGVGAIASTFAHKATSLGMKVIGVRRDARKPHETIDDIAPSSDLRKRLGEADFVVIALPLTEETRGMFGAEELHSMKPTAYLLNVGRGGIVDEQALEDALHSGVIAGAAFDVFENEPLPPHASLRDAPNLLITPHYAGWTPKYARRLWDIFLANAERYGNGQPLLNVVDPKAGY